VESFTALLTEAVMTIEGATDADGFRAEVHEGLGLTLREGDLVVAHSLSAHKAAGMPPRPALACL
jgi:hypothetical protein